VRGKSLRRALWVVATLVYAAATAFIAWLVIDEWIPADGPRWQAFAYAAGWSAALLLLYTIGALPFCLRPGHPLARSGAHAAAAAISALAAFVVLVATWGGAFVNAYLLAGLAAANAYAALRSGLGRSRALVALSVLVFAVVAVVSLASFWLAAVAIAVVIAAAARGSRRRGRLRSPA
jgi:hypothetical protein